MTDKELISMRQEIAQCDADQSRAAVEEFDRNPPKNELERMRLLWIISEQFRERHLDIIKRYNEAPPLRIQSSTLDA